MVNPADTSVTIVGAGIVGLTTALQLHAVGFRDVHVFERVAKIEPLGVGIGIQAGASLVLRNLGLKPAMDKLAVASYGTLMHNRFGSRIRTVNISMVPGVPSYFVHRGKLQMLLLAAVRDRLGADHVHLDHGYVRSEETAAGRITAHFAAHGNAPCAIASRDADVLIGADGIRSAMRAQQYPSEGAPRFSGLQMWRGATWRAPYLDGHTLSFFGYSDKWFLCYPISPPDHAGQQLFNWICVQRTHALDEAPHMPPPANVGWDEHVPKDQLLEDYKGWEFDGVTVQDAIRGSNPIWLYPMVDRDPVERWSFGRLTLIGDAAHPMYPFGGNGASAGILDAASLATHLTQSADVASGLRAYEAERLPATTAVVHANRGPGGIQKMADLVHERAPDGFEDIEAVVSSEELEAISSGYLKATSNDAATVNARALASEGEAERRGLVPPAEFA